jgi:hypothetical protein
MIIKYTLISSISIQTPIRVVAKQLANDVLSSSSKYHIVQHSQLHLTSYCTTSNLT